MILVMRIKMSPRSCLALALILSSRATAPPPPTPQSDPARQLHEYREFAMGHDGSASRGRELFFSEQWAACAKCHSVDGRSGRAEPDLFAVGDRFPRRELIGAVLEPSAAIAVGYGT